MDTETTSMLDRVIAELDRRRGQWRQIAAAAGVPHKVVANIGYRVVKDPGVSKVEKLDEYFRANPATHRAA